MKYESDEQIEKAIWGKYLEGQGILEIATRLKIDYYVVKRYFTKFTEKAAYEKTCQKETELMQLRNIETELFDLYDKTKDYIGRLPVRISNKVANLESIYVRTK